MDQITAFVKLLLTPLTVLGDPGQPWSVYFLAACMVFTLGFVARARRGGRLPRLAPFMRFLFERPSYRDLHDKRQFGRFKSRPVWARSNFAGLRVDRREPPSHSRAPPGVT